MRKRVSRRGARIIAALIDSSCARIDSWRWNHESRTGVIPTVNRFTSSLIVFGALTAGAYAQQGARPGRAILTGHMHPRARPESDQGRASPALQLSYVTLTLTQSKSQQASLD